MEDGVAHSAKIRGTMAAAAFDCVARVEASSRAVDLAISVSNARLVIIRHVDHDTPEDQSALATMISEGDFIWGAVVYEQGGPPHSPGLIESFHVSQLDQLVARLIELREACREAG